MRLGPPQLDELSDLTLAADLHFSLSEIEQIRVRAKDMRALVRCRGFCYDFCSDFCSSPVERLCDREGRGP
jgi:hypothetical protein